MCRHPRSPRRGLVLIGTDCPHYIPRSGKPDTAGSTWLLASESD